MNELVFDREFAATAGTVERLSPLVRRVLCDNPGPFTFTGTSSYIVGSGRVAIIDPGPDDPAHLAALLEAVAGETVTHILVTHSHADHSPLARRLAALTGAATYGYGAIAPDPAAGPRLDSGVDHDFIPGVKLAHGDAIEGPGWTLEALFTPGHMSNHLCFGLAEERSLFAGDHVMAWSTSVVAPPDGHMGDYMDSLRLLLDRDDRLYLPGHGPARAEPQQLVRGLIGHRRMREAAILARLRQGDRTIAQLVAAIYANIDRRLHGAAALSTRAHLDHLAERGVVRESEGHYEAVTGKT
jgi:glyoxylase-like metal-dependent hydrolase (beta-lactamase superfamily II)